MENKIDFSALATIVAEAKSLPELEVWGGKLKAMALKESLAIVGQILKNLADPNCSEFANEHLICKLDRVYAAYKFLLAA